MKGNIMKKLYLGIIRDHSGSMASKANAACQDFNEQIQKTVESAQATGLNVLVSVIECGVNSGDAWNRESANKWDAVLTPVDKVEKLWVYKAIGNTPLYDAIGMMIEHFNLMPDIKDAQVLIEIMSDGEENASRRYARSTISELIRAKNREDNWTIAARSNSAQGFVQIGIPQENVFIWDGLTSQSLHATTAVATEARTTYMASVAAGTMRKTEKFYTDMSKVSSAQIASSMTDISKNVRVFTTTGVEEIKPFVERMTGSYVKGTAYYQLTKTEDTVQDYKNIIIVDKTTGAAYAGKDARSLLNLPTVGNCKIVPGNHGNFEIYIQSTSINRKLPASTKLIVWDPMSQIQPAPAKPLTVISPPVTNYKKLSTATTGQLTASASTEKDAYVSGYKDGRRRQKNKWQDYPIGSLAQLKYKEGFTDGKAKQPAKYAL